MTEKPIHEVVLEINEEGNWQIRSFPPLPEITDKWTKNQMRVKIHELQSKGELVEGKLEATQRQLRKLQVEISDLKGDQMELIEKIGVLNKAHKATIDVMSGYELEADG